MSVLLRYESSGCSKTTNNQFHLYLLSYLVLFYSMCMLCCDIAVHYPVHLCFMFLFVHAVVFV